MVQVVNEQLESAIKGNDFEEVKQALVQGADVVCMLACS